MTAFINALKDRQLLRTALFIAIVVGTLLVLINYGDLIIAGQWQQLPIIKMMLTYCVPFCVSSYSAAMHKVNNPC